MHRFAKHVSTRLTASAASSRRLLHPHSICVAFFSSNEAPQMGKPLTAEELAERRAQRAARRAATDKDDAKEDKFDAMFIEGSVRAYLRHYVIVEPQNTDPNSWPAKLERSPEHILSSYRGALVKKYGGDVNMVKKSPLLVTAAIPYAGACSGGLPQGSEEVESREEGAHDILVFPDGLRVHNVVPAQISTLVSKSLEKDLDFPALLEKENLQYTRMEEGYHMMVCGHAARDERCGCKGPELLQWLKDSTAEANKPLNLWTSSHYGGHRYAAACIVYPSGDWFGLLNEEDKAKSMIDVMNDEDPLRLYELWRGRMGLTVPEMHQAVKERVESPGDIAENA